MSVNGKDYIVLKHRELKGHPLYLGDYVVTISRSIYQVLDFHNPTSDGYFIKNKLIKGTNLSAGRDDLHSSNIEMIFKTQEELFEYML